MSTQRPDPLDKHLKDFVNDYDTAIDEEWYEIAKHELKLFISKEIAEIIGEDMPCEKSHKEYFDWCSYCDYERQNMELRDEQRKRAIEKGYQVE